MLSKLFTTLFLSIFIAAGVFFGTTIFNQTDRQLGQQGWVEHPATVVSSRVEIDEASEEPYTPRIEYTYDYAGATYTGTAISDSDVSTRDYAEAQAYVLAYPADSAATAYVDPDNPADSVLTADTLRALGSLAMGVVFVSAFAGIPLVILIGMWWPGRNSANERAAEARRRGKHATSGRWLGLLIGLLFTGVGLGLFVFMTVLPLVRTVAAQSWLEVPCVVERSAVLRSEGDDGPTYRIDILYFYEVDGRSYGSNRYSFAQLGSSSGYDGKREVADRYPVGFETTCYVSPSDPSRAVLHRGLTLANLWGLFPIPFAAGGLFVLFATLRQGKKDNAWRPSTSSARRSASSASDATQVGDEPVVLDPSKSRRNGFIGVLFFAIGWNGITFVLSKIFLIDPLLAGDWEWGAAIFFTIFHLIGLGFVIGAIRKLMLMFAPVVVVELSRQAIPLGGSAELTWRIPGLPGKVKRVTVTLIGEESATYTRGTDTVTDTETFFERVLVGEADDAESVPEYRSPGRMHDSGDALILIPADTMHSFEAEHNKIVWRLEVKAEVPRWPDPKDRYPLTVLPMATGRAEEA